MSDLIIATEKEINSSLRDMSQRICADVQDLSMFAIVGIQTRGVELARRIQNHVKEISGRNVPLGTLDISLFRDDIATRGVLPTIKETRIEFDITRITILLVDDVIFTGRTMKAAIENLMTFGRPGAIRLLELVDRGNRELPIQPDYCGFKVKTELKDNISVRLKEVDNVEDAIIHTKATA